MNAKRAKAIRRMVRMILENHPEIPESEKPAVSRYLFNQLVKRFEGARHGAQQSGKAMRVRTPTPDTSDGGQDSMGG